MRPSIQEYFLDLAEVISRRSTCPRLKVGCIIVDKHNHILSTGYNGVAAGLPHCTEFPCPGAEIKPGMNTGTCEAIHAEQNALLQCSDVNKISAIYITHSPCKTCAKLILNTAAKRVVFTHRSEGRHTEAIDLLEKAGRQVIWDDT